MRHLGVTAHVFIFSVPKFWANASDEGCRTACEFENQTATCKARIGWATKHVFEGHPDACGRAHALVMRQCPHCSGSCSRSEAGCADIQSATSTETTTSSPEEAEAAPEDAKPDSATSMPGAGCNSVCAYAGTSRTCSARIKHAVDQVSAGNEDSICDLAYNRVIEECPSCSACSAASAGCLTRRRRSGDTAHAISMVTKVTTPSPKSLHISGLRQPPSAPTVTSVPPSKSATTSLGQDCTAVFVTCEKGFASAKKQALCDEHMGPCLQSGKENYDCMQVYEKCQAGWSVRVLDWALQQDVEPFPTTMPVPTLAPTPAPVVPSGLGAWENSVSTPEPVGDLSQSGHDSPFSYDCHAGYSNWAEGWSRGKKEWCCQMTGLGCPEYAASTSLPNEAGEKAPSVGTRGKILFKKFEQSPTGPLAVIDLVSGRTSAAGFAAGSAVFVLMFLMVAMARSRVVTRVSVNIAGQVAAACGLSDADRPPSEQQACLIDIDAERPSIQ